MHKVTTGKEVQEPGYGSIWLFESVQILIMGNCTHQWRDGTVHVWAADWATGIRLDPDVSKLQEYGGAQPSLMKIVGRVSQWARDGNDDAMWWLGHFYEFGSREISANGGKALAYYLGAIRRKLGVYDPEIIYRVLYDGFSLFKAGHPPEVEDCTPTDADQFLLQFREYRDLDKREAHYPDTADWAECIRIAEALN